MFTSLFLELCKTCDRDFERGEGVAFLKAMQALYGLESICYLGLNLPNARASGSFVHCLYSSSKIHQKTTGEAIATRKLNQLGLIQTALVDWRGHERLAIELDLRCAGSVLTNDPHGASLFLNSSFGEVALCGFAAVGDQAPWIATSTLMHELRILAQYFHSHMLRLNGNEMALEMLVSARELDCLSHTAEGKDGAGGEPDPGHFRADRPVPPEFGARQDEVRQHHPGGRQGRRPEPDPGLWRVNHCPSDDRP